MYSLMPLLLAGIFACSTAVIMIKLSAVDAIFLSSYRLLVAALILTPFFLREHAKVRREFSTRTLFKRSAIPGCLLGAHFILWILGARMTPAANSSLVVNMVPVVMPFCMYLLAREKLNAWEFLGTALSLAGVGVLARSDFQWSREWFAGDILCLVSMLLLTLYLALARRNSAGISLWLYIVPLYYIGGALCFIVGLVAGRVPGPFAVREILLVLALACVPTIIGHSSLNYCTRKMRGQVVAIANLSQFVFAGLLAWWLLDETPAHSFYPASALVIAGAVVTIWFGPGTPLPTELKMVVDESGES